MTPRITVYIDFNSPYSFLSAVRIYLIHNTSIEARKKTTQYAFSSTDITHPTIQKVKLEMKPIEFGIILAKSGVKGPPITPGSGRAIYMWNDVARALKRMGIEGEIEVPNNTWWPQKVSMANRISYVLMSGDTFDKAAKEIIADYKKENYDSSWRNTVTESGSTLEEAITSEYIFRVYEQLFFKHSKLTDESVHSDILDKILAKYPDASRGFGGSSTIIKLAANSKNVKNASFEPTQDAINRGIFGVPAFVDGGDSLFWGNDHLVDATISACEAQMVLTAFIFFGGIASGNIDNTKPDEKNKSSDKTLSGGFFKSWSFSKPNTRNRELFDFNHDIDPNQEITNDIFDLEPPGDIDIASPGYLKAKQMEREREQFFRNQHVDPGWVGSQNFNWGERVPSNIDNPSNRIELDPNDNFLVERQKEPEKKNNPLDGQLGRIRPEQTENNIFRSDANSTQDMNTGFGDQNVVDLETPSKKDNINSYFDPSYINALTRSGTSSGTNQWVMFVAGLCFGTFLVVLFSVLRLKFKYIFSPRTRLKIIAPPKLSKNLFGWIIPTLNTSDAHILNSLGLDAYIFLRFYKMCLRLLVDVGLIGIIIVYPINVLYATKDLDKFMNKSPKNSTLPSHLKTSKTSTLLFNSTKAVDYAENKYLILVHIVFAYVFTILAFYHFTKFTSQWASLRWHFLMCARNSTVSRTVMLRKIPKFLVQKPESLKWMWEEGIGAGNVENIKICPEETGFLKVIRKRAKALGNLEREYQRILGNPCTHPEYDRERLFEVVMKSGKEARDTERMLLTKWAQSKHLRRIKSNESTTKDLGVVELANNNKYELKRSKMLIRDPEYKGKGIKFIFVDKLDFLRDEFIKLDKETSEIRKVYGNDSPSSTAFVTFEDAATAHMVCQLSTYPNPSKMIASMAPEPRGVYWENMNFSSKKKRWRKYMQIVMLITIMILWVPPVIFLGSLLSPATLNKIGVLGALFERYSILRSLAYSALPSLVLVLFFNILPWILKQIVFYGGATSLQEMDFSVLTKTWLFLVYNVIGILCLSGAVWDVIVRALDDPRSVLEKFADTLPGFGYFFTSYVFILGVVFQPFKLLQLRPAVWHMLQRWVCHSPREFAKLAAPVYIDWYNVYPYPMLVFTISMIYSTFSPIVVWVSILYYAIGYVVMKYQLLYLYFRNYESGGMMWPKILVRMIVSVIIFQLIIAFFAITRTSPYWGLAMLPLLIGSFTYLYVYGINSETRFQFIPMYLWKHPPPNNSYPRPPFEGPSSPLERYSSFMSAPTQVHSLNLSHTNLGKEKSELRDLSYNNASGSVINKRMSKESLQKFVNQQKNKFGVNNKGDYLSFLEAIYNNDESSNRKKLTSTENNTYTSLAGLATAGGKHLVKTIARLPSDITRKVRKASSKQRNAKSPKNSSCQPSPKPLNSNHQNIIKETRNVETPLHKNDINHGSLMSYNTEIGNGSRNFKNDKADQLSYFTSSTDYGSLRKRGMSTMKHLSLDRINSKRQGIQSFSSSSSIKSNLKYQKRVDGYKPGTKPNSKQILKQKLGNELVKATTKNLKHSGSNSKKEEVLLRQEIRNLEKLIMEEEGGFTKNSVESLYEGKLERIGSTFSLFQKKKPYSNMNLISNANKRLDIETGLHVSNSIQNVLKPVEHALITKSNKNMLGKKISEYNNYYNSILPTNYQLQTNLELFPSPIVIKNCNVEIDQNFFNHGIGFNYYSNNFSQKQNEPKRYFDGDLTMNRYSQKNNEYKHPVEYDDRKVLIKGRRDYPISKQNIDEDMNSISINFSDFDGYESDMKNGGHVQISRKNNFNDDWDSNIDSAMTYYGSGESLERRGGSKSNMKKIKSLAQEVQYSVKTFLFRDFNPAAAILDGSIDLLFSNTALQLFDHTKKEKPVFGYDFTYNSFKLSKNLHGTVNRNKRKRSFELPSFLSTKPINENNSANFVFGNRTYPTNSNNVENISIFKKNDDFKHFNGLGLKRSRLDTNEPQNTPNTIQSNNNQFYPDSPNSFGRPNNTIPNGTGIARSLTYNSSTRSVYGFVSTQANYQRFSAESQHELLPNKRSDYVEPPMLRVEGILDGSVNDYVHPGLYGTLPQLWLPVKNPKN
ncbi:hypothetical protein BB559_003517 [Furculomyces boomerangus]|uniref:DUF221-domain-containing protein n=1 Tax=Furculomyces boomerangus TaxID=61424 RepID=A0A2T9YKU1_9FUNG|nr:hypothetical protein BB559_003517 [Furculomyces boomerangus]